MLNKFWTTKIRFNWIFGLILVIILGVPRFMIVLRANVTGHFYFVPVVFLTMWLLPFVLLSAKGRKYIGFSKVTNKPWIVYSFLSGAGICLTIYFIGIFLFKDTISNWFVYISKSGAASGDMDSRQRLVYFLISASMSMLFSPIGEELFYRGLVHGSFQVNVGDNRASYIDSMAFAVTHLAHFGIVYSNDQWDLLLLPAVLWVFLMFLTSRIFYLCKKRTGSLLGAIISHAAFNLTMMYLIFYWILK